MSKPVPTVVRIHPDQIAQRKRPKRAMTWETAMEPGRRKQDSRRRLTPEATGDFKSTEAK
jgi:hypothetical protein